MRRQHSAACRLSGAAFALVLAAWSGAAAQEDENPHTPGAIPNPGSYQGSMELQRRSDQQDQQFRQQQQRSYQQPSYQQPRYGAQPYPRAPQAAPAPRPDAQVFGKESAGDILADKANARGDFAGAVRIWLPLAEKGDINAQYNMGVMYELGHGVPMNPVQAAMWYRKAADKGYATAMLNLAAIVAQHARGSADLIPAYTWSLLASDRDRSVRAAAQRNLSLLTAHMSRAQIRRAQAAARNWTPH